MPNIPDRWYHGSEHSLTELRPGSSITRNHELARAFSHRPSWVSIQDDGRIDHDGFLPGYLYEVAEPVSPDDLLPVPGSTMPPGLERHTTRPLALRLMERTFAPVQRPAPTGQAALATLLRPNPALQRIVNALADYQVALEPDRDIPEWWAGAPSVARDDDGVFYLAARMREGDSPRGRRGYEVRLLRSDDGLRFEPIAHITRESCGLLGFERPALVRDPHSRRFKLYGCAAYEEGWAIIKWDDADDPAAFDPRSVRRVLWEGGPPQDGRPEEGFARVTGYKDPVVFWDGDTWHLFVIACDRVERIGHWLSADGEVWKPAGPSAVLEHTGWHDFYVRPACVLPLAVGYLFVYEGSSIRWRDPVYNIATGLAYSLDLCTFYDLTPHQPLLLSTTPGDYHTWRYSHWEPVDGRIYVCFEAARPNNTNELRVAVLPGDALRSAVCGRA